MTQDINYTKMFYDFGWSEYLVKKCYVLRDAYKRHCIFLLSFEVNQIPIEYVNSYVKAYEELSDFLTINGIPKLKKGRL